MILNGINSNINIEWVTLSSIKLEDIINEDFCNFFNNTKQFIEFDI